MMATQRPSSDDRATMKPRARTSIVWHHLRGFAMVLPPCVAVVAFIYLTPPRLHPMLYATGLLVSLILSVTFGFWLAARLRCWYDARTTSEEN